MDIDRTIPKPVDVPIPDIPPVINPKLPDTEKKRSRKPSNGGGARDEGDQAGE